MITPKKHRLSKLNCTNPDQGSTWDKPKGLQPSTNTSIVLCIQMQIYIYYIN